MNFFLFQFEHFDQSLYDQQTHKKNSQITHGV